MYGMLGMLFMQLTLPCVYICKCICWKKENKWCAVNPHHVDQPPMFCWVRCDWMFKVTVVITTTVHLHLMLKWGDVGIDWADDVCRYFLGQRCHRNNSIMSASSLSHDPVMILNLSSLVVADIHFIRIVRERFQLWVLFTWSLRFCCC